MGLSGCSGTTNCRWAWRFWQHLILLRQHKRAFYSQPPKLRVATKQVLEFVRAADEEVDSIYSLMFLRHDKVVMEVWWLPESANKPLIL